MNTHAHTNTLIPFPAFRPSRSAALQVPRRYHALFPKPPKNDNDSEIKEGAKTLFNQQLASGVARHPVIVAFHGNGGDGASLAMQTPHLATLAPKQGYFLIYADGVQTPGSKLRCQEYVVLY